MVGGERYRAIWRCCGQDDLLRIGLQIAIAQLQLIGCHQVGGGGRVAVDQQVLECFQAQVGGLNLGGVRNCKAGEASIQCHRLGEGVINFQGLSLEKIAYLALQRDQQISGFTVGIQPLQPSQLEIHVVAGIGRQRAHAALESRRSSLGGDLTIVHIQHKGSADGLLQGAELEIAIVHGDGDLAIAAIEAT